MPCSRTGCLPGTSDLEQSISIGREKYPGIIKGVEKGAKIPRGDVLKNSRAGIGKSDITPEVGVELCGYGAFLERKSTGVHDPLFCKALFLESGEESGLILICDLISISDFMVGEIRSSVSSRFSISPENILVGGTHTHSGPNTGGYIAWGEEDKDYISSLSELILPAVEKAFNDLREVTVGVGHISIEGEEISVNRIQAEKGVNKEIGLIKLVEAENENPIAFLVNYGAHAVVQGSANTLISRDWPGTAADLIAEKLGAETIFLQGACGDINSRPVASKDPEEGFRQIERIGNFFTEAAIAGLQKMSVKKIEKLSFKQTFIDLPLSPISRETLLEVIRDNEAIIKKEGAGKQAERTARFQITGAKRQLALYEKDEVDFKKIEIQTIEINDGLIITVPAELYSEFAHALKEKFPQKKVFVVTCTNGTIGYIPSVYDFKNKLYASVVVPRICGNMPFQKDVGDFLIRNILKEKAICLQAV